MREFQLIVGLGNPGDQYARTRHNVGYWAVSALADKHDLTWRQAVNSKASCCQLMLSTKRIWLFKSSSYMNDSGRDISLMANYYNISHDKIMVLHDELDFPPGTVRVKQSGGHGGHNGIRSVMNHLGQSDFTRVRFGIGRGKQAVERYVLTAPTSSEVAMITSAIDLFTRFSDDLIAGDFNRAVENIHAN
ncbi:MAG: aminoacyl-tRNA hydrolase [Legionellales bacterium]|nr:aminoacyl-tRNA hydrolase [Legionellales bacterium]|tara:strand:+ start:736 stop:1305 length:570 start_codon:yes stop_codon:yes gene_type:complete